MSPKTITPCGDSMMGRAPRVHRPVLFLLILPLLFVAQDVTWGIGEHCSLKAAAERLSCYERVLDDIIRSQGTRQALVELQQLVEHDQEARRQAHPLAHHIGRLSYLSYNNSVAQAFQQCTDGFASGCYHGVLEAHLSGFPHLVPADVAEVCRPVLDPVRPAFTHFLCVHGLGHGLTMYFKGDILKALSYCDGLTSGDHEECYGGVFMQNIVTFDRQGARHDSHGGHTGHNATAEKKKHLDPNDQLYPCTVVAKKYLRACYMLQSSGILAMNGDNFAKTFTACEKAPAEYLKVCIASVGRDISAFTLNNPKATKAMCGIAPPHLIGPCLRGAARDFFYTRADTGLALALCRIADDANKKDCYKGIRDIIIDFYPDEQKRKEVCRTAERGYQALCWGASRWMFWLD